MSHYARSNRVLAEVTTATSIASAADIGTWTVTSPITVARVGALVTVAQTGAAPTLSFDLRPTYGSDTGRLAGKVGVCTFPAGGVGIGKTVTVEVRTKVNAGQQIVCAVTGAGGAGTAIPIIEWVPRTENAGNQSGAQLGGATQPSPLQLAGMRSMLDGADLSIPIQMGGAAPVMVSAAPEGEEVDEEEQAEQRAKRDEEIRVGPRPFPHQAGALGGLPQANAATMAAYAEQLIAEGERLKERAERQAEEEKEQAERDKQEQEERQRKAEEQRQQRQEQQQARYAPPPPQQA